MTGKLSYDKSIRHMIASLAEHILARRGRSENFEKLPQ